MSDEQKSASLLIEEGVGLIAKGAYRLKETHGANEAVGDLSAAISVIVGIKHDFMRLEARAALTREAGNE